LPVLRLSASRLLRLTGIEDLSLSDLLALLPRLKCEAKLVDEDVIEVEVDRDRPDLFSAEGIAKAIRMYLWVEKPRKVSLESIAFRVRVDPPRKRPYIAIAAVEGVQLGDTGLEELIQFQEKIHLSYGRRKRVAIGLHDLNKLPCSDLEYRYVDVKTKMIPLHHREPMTVLEVLENTEQGREYGSIARDGDLHPAILSCGEVISLPPVINSDITRLEPSTRNILIDVTGTDPRIVEDVLNVIVHVLSHYGGKIYGAQIIYPHDTVVTPSLSWRRMVVDRSFAEEWLGIEIPRGIDLARLLERMGLVLVEDRDTEFIVEVPPYRIDILHPVDVLEDLAMAMGYDNIAPEPIEVAVRAKRSPLEKLVDSLRDLAIGLGYVEIRSLTLISSELLKLLGLDNYAAIENPLQRELDALRPSPLPSLMQVLKHSQHATHPVKVFEVGEALIRDPRSSTGWSTRILMGLAILNSIIKFEDMHADVFAILRSLGLEPETRRPSERLAYCIEGRSAVIKVCGENIGMLCEINPSVLESLGIEHPVAYAEIDVEKLLSVLERMKRL